MNWGKDYAVFEPTHGSAPDIAGKGIANPIAMMLSAVLMLGHVGLHAKATALESAIAHTLGSGKIRTADMGAAEPSRTEQVADAIVSALG